MVTKNEVMEMIVRPWDMFPICIPSYKRPEIKDNRTMKTILASFTTEQLKNVYLFVRDNEAEAYRNNISGVNIIVLPEVHGLASTRQFIFDYVVDTLHQPFYIDMDDDITGLSFVYEDEVKVRLSKREDAGFWEILRYGCAIAKMAFEVDGCVFGNFHRQRFSTTGSDCAELVYKVNKGSTPRQVTFVNAKKIKEKGVVRSMDFERTGDDMGFVAVLAQAHLDMFQIPCLTYAFVDDALNSTIRNADNRREIAAFEYEQLKKYPIKDYLRISQKFEDGAYRFSDINYRSYCKLCNRPQSVRSLKDFKKWANIQ